jgi:signal transduction histidine kinase
MLIIPDVQLPGYITRRRGGGGDGPEMTGPATQTLASVAVRTAAIIRCMSVGYIAAQAAIWHGYDAADPVRLLGPAAMTVWAVVLLVLLARSARSARLTGRPLTAGLAAADCLVVAAIAVCAAWSVPPALRGDTASWLYIVIAGEVVVPLWFAPLAVAVPLLLGLGAAYWAGAVLPGPAVAGDTLGASLALLLTIAAVVWSGYQILSRRAARADIALGRADAEEHEQHVALSLNAERREHERLLHDTVLNTLAALSRSGQSVGDAHDVVGRCRHDVALMEYVLGAPSTAAQAAGRSFGGLVVAIEALSAEMLARGLTVHTQITTAARATTGAAGPSGGQQPDIPVPVVVAVARALREALNNVARHGGTSDAFIELCLTEAGHGRTEPDDGAAGRGITVAVRDHGAGFDPAAVGPAQLGIRRSIVERLADCGGAVSVVSAPGQGTTVTLRWPAPPGQPPQPRQRAGRADDAAPAGSGSPPW